MEPEIDSLGKFYSNINGAPDLLQNWVRVRYCDRGMTNNWPLRRDFYKLTIKYRDRFGEWPPEALWPVIMDQVKHEN